MEYTKIGTTGMHPKYFSKKKKNCKSNYFSCQIISLHGEENQTSGQIEL